MFQANIFAAAMQAVVTGRGRNYEEENAGLKAEFANYCADTDDYDPRKPEYLIPASKADIDAEVSRTIESQIAKLEFSLEKRAHLLPDDVCQHYESVLMELRESAGRNVRSHVRVRSEPWSLSSSSQLPQSPGDLPTSLNVSIGDCGRDLREDLPTPFCASPTHSNVGKCRSSLSASPCGGKLGGLAASQVQSARHLQRSVVSQPLLSSRQLAAHGPGPRALNTERLVPTQSNSHIVHSPRMSYRAPSTVSGSVGHHSRVSSHHVRKPLMAVRIGQAP